MIYVEVLSKTKGRVDAKTGTEYQILDVAHGTKDFVQKVKRAKEEKYSNLYYCYDNIKCHKIILKDLDKYNFDK